MARWTRQAQSTPSANESALTGRLRFEIADEEERALLGSYAISSSLGLIFLLLVQFGPRVPVVPIVPVERPPFGPVIVGNLRPGGSPTPILGRSQRNGGGRSVRVGTASVPATGTISSAFAAGGSATTGQPYDILGSVALAPSGAPGAATGGKAVLAYGEGGVGSMPGRGGISAGSNGNEIGGVTRGGSVTRSASQVGALPVVSADPLPPAGNVAAVGTHVRGNESQLRFCYQEVGLAANPALAGSITVAITVAGNGSVSNASVTKRTWSGAGAAESEACILRSIRGWRLPATGASSSTYSFPFNFSR
jgi:hypothetical protein